MTIGKTCDMLRGKLYNNGFEYGFVCGGKKYKPDVKRGFDNEFFDLLQTVYLVQAPEITIKEKIGTCIDAVLVMKRVLDKSNVPCKIWLLHNKVKNKMHTVLTFEAEKSLVYLELTPQFSKEWCGKELIYSSESTFVEAQEKIGWSVSDITELVVAGNKPTFLLV